MNDPNSIDIKKRRNARIQMLLILAFAFLPFFAAQLIYWNPAGLFDCIIPQSIRTKGAEVVSTSFGLSSKNFPGELIHGGEKSAYGLWTLLHIIDAPCDTSCTDYILYQRQLYLTQGRFFEALQPVVLFTKADYLPVTEFDFEENIPMMSVYVMGETEASSFKNEWFKWFEQDRNGLILLDRRARSALYFAPDLQPTSARKDLARIMRLNNS